jgi:xanthine dehydrogenase accessory factor
MPRRVEREDGGMRDLAPTIRPAIAAGRAVRIARVVGFEGFGGRRAGETLVLFDDGASAGSLLGGAADGTLRASGTDAPSLVEVRIGDAEAVGAGLACGGVATVLLSDASRVPLGAWSALEAGWPVALVTAVFDDPGRGTPAITMAFVDDPVSRSLERHGSLPDPGIDDAAELAARQALRWGRDSTDIQRHGDVRLVVEASFPSTTLVVVGSGDLAEALAAQGRLLRWSVVVEDRWQARTADIVGSFGWSDAVVVLSHDAEVDTPALAAALGAGCYVGALGSRHTQAARRERLQALGVDDASIDRVHGPVGLDLGARTPEETAVATVAEILAHRSGRVPTSLRSTSGAING